MTLFTKFSPKMKTISNSFSISPSNKTTSPTRQTITTVNSIFDKLSSKLEIEEIAVETSPSPFILNISKDVFSEAVENLSTEQTIASSTSQLGTSPGSSGILGGKELTEDILSSSPSGNFRQSLLPPSKQDRKFSISISPSVSDLGGSSFLEESKSPENTETTTTVSELNQGAGLHDKEKPFIAGILSEDITSLGYAKKATLFVRRLKSERFKEREYVIYRRNIFTEENFKIISTIKTNNYEINPKYIEIIKERIPISINEMFSFTDKDLDGNFSYAYKIELKYDTLTQEERDQKNIQKIIQEKGSSILNSLGSADFAEAIKEIK